MGGFLGGGGGGSQTPVRMVVFRRENSKTPVKILIFLRFLKDSGEEGVGLVLWVLLYNNIEH